MGRFRSVKRSSSTGSSNKSMVSVEGGLTCSKEEVVNAMFQGPEVHTEWVEDL
uniref:Uncharacterized protein n=1 Tax=Rhizophora mucronata TaxID=61149 RepID=A0A2P2NFQ7_RHIMU